MSPLETQIVADYENNGTPIELIAEDLGLEELAVKATLLQYSRAYKEASKSPKPDGPVQEVSADEKEEYFRALKLIASTAESEHLRARILMRLIDENKGRLDKRVRVSNSPVRQNVQINVLQLNDALRAARAQELEGTIDTIKQLTHQEAL